MSPASQDKSRHSPRHQGRVGGKCRIVIADDHTLMREGLRGLVESCGKYEVVESVDNGRDAVRAVVTHQPEIVLMDLTMPHIDGLAAIQELKHRSAKTKILVVTMHRSEAQMRAALEAGADGYVLKEASHSELLMAMESILAGRTFISPAVAARVVTGYLGRDKDTSTNDVLTRREKQVLKLIAEGRRNRDIAQYLYLSVKTVEKHRANLMAKLNLHNAASLTAFALQNTTLVA